MNATLSIHPQQTAQGHRAMRREPEYVPFAGRLATRRLTWVSGRSRPRRAPLSGSEWCRP
jgi:hypothetical protein